MEAILRQPEVVTKVNFFHRCRTRADSWTIMALVIISAVWLFRSPYSASDLTIVPDSVEYALAPMQMLDSGQYAIKVEGRLLPPRYPPWFSSLVILPSYLLLGREPGNAILPITALAVIGIYFAFCLGRKISNLGGGIVAAIVLGSIPSYHFWGRETMSDVPCTALMLGGCLLFLRLRNTSEPKCYFIAGVLVAITALFRPVSAAMLLPFTAAALAARKQTLRSLVCLAFPVLAAVALTVFYNWRTFGSPTRNGYHFWTAVPSDYFSLVFSTANIPTNISVVLATALPLLLAAIGLLGIIIFRRRRALELTELSQVSNFFVLTLAPALIFHLLYFFPSDRFFLPLLAGSAVLVGGMTGLVLTDRIKAAVTPILASLSLVV